jgi:hypothetical protein
MPHASQPLIGSAPVDSAAPSVEPLAVPVPSAIELPLPGSLDPPEVGPEPVVGEDVPPCESLPSSSPPHAATETDNIDSSAYRVRSQFMPEMMT